MLKEKTRVKAKARGNTRKSAHSKTGKKIKTKEAYGVVMKEIDALTKIGEENLNASQLNRLRVLAEAAEVYEDTNEPLPLPSKLPDIIKMKMFQLRLNQHFTAQLLGISEAKFSLIMNGKQKPDIYFLKAVHEKLEVDANVLMEAL